MHSTRDARVLRVVTTADTEILATAAALERLPEDFPEVRCANPGGVDRRRGPGRRAARRRARGALPHPRRAGAAGRAASTCCARAAPSAASRCSRWAARREPDAEMTALSLAPVGRGRAGRRVPAPRRRRQRRAAAALPRRHLPARGLRLRAAARGAPTSASTCPGVGDVAHRGGARAATTRSARRSASASTARTA